jgi:hypothetical protein
MPNEDVDHPNIIRVLQRPSLKCRKCFAVHVLVSTGKHKQMKHKKNLYDHGSRRTGGVNKAICAFLANIFLDSVGEYDSLHGNDLVAESDSL